ncbi:MAG: hypothetical protein JOY80_02410 [Candidatus Dormibacteraeota bacterium]|nr:hypothetical protein [Candidatus Dormibacteraeota bacterium]
MDTTLRILDEVTGSEVQRCTGPASDGSCPRVAIGDLLPCAGHALMPERSTGQPYAVSGQATLCPVTLAAALAVDSDSAFTSDR